MLLFQYKYIIFIKILIKKFPPKILNSKVILFFGREILYTIILKKINKLYNIYYLKLLKIILKINSKVRNYKIDFFSKKALAKKKEGKNFWEKKFSKKVFETNAFFEKCNSENANSGGKPFLYILLNF